MRLAVAATVMFVSLSPVAFPFENRCNIKGLITDIVAPIRSHESA